MIEPPLSRQLWRDLRLPLLLLLLVVGASAGIAFTTINFSNQWQQAYQQHQQQWRTLRQNHHQLEQDQQRIDTWLPAFETLRQQGFIGEEDRLAWVNALYAAADRVQLPALHHRFDAQRNYDPKGVPVSSGIKLQVSRMTIQAELLHEEDLLRLLRSLAHYTGAWYKLQHCSLQRNRQAVAQPLVAGNLTAVCSLDWITGSINRAP